MDKLHIEPVTGALGARVEGIDLARAGPQELAQVQAALNQHLVIYLPDQDLDRFALSRLGRFFGPPFLHPLVDNGFIDCPVVIELLRKPEDVISFGGSTWGLLGWPWVCCWGWGAVKKVSRRRGRQVR